ncbi:MAG: twin-arginine translocase TatA/TatE family subunit [Gaiella sp.]
MPFGIGIWEMLILLVAVLLIFGPKRLPEMGRQLGRGMREFKDSVTGKDDESTVSSFDDVAGIDPPETTSTASTRERDVVS